MRMRFLENCAASFQGGSCAGHSLLGKLKGRGADTNRPLTVLHRPVQKHWSFALQRTLIQLLTRDMKTAAMHQEWYGGMMTAMVLQQSVDPISIRLIALFLSLVFIIPIVKFFYRKIQSQVELFLRAAMEQDNDLEQ